MAGFDKSIIHKGKNAINIFILIAWRNDDDIRDVSMTSVAL